MNVDWPRTRLSEAPTRVNRRSTTPMLARRQGTNELICASTTQSPPCRSNVDLPAMLGPARRSTLVFTNSRGLTEKLAWALRRRLPDWDSLLGLHHSSQRPCQLLRQAARVREDQR